MELTEQQKITVAEWVKERCGLSEIQSRIQNEFKLRPTFMDVRFLILDLGLEIYDSKAEVKEPANEEAVEAGVDAVDEAADVAPFADDEEQAPDSASSVSVEVDLVMKPGALVSGTVVFSDGVKAAWMLDQYGRLALDAQTPGYRPSPEDVEGFQQALQKEIAKKGY